MTGAPTSRALQAEASARWCARTSPWIGGYYDPRTPLEMLDCGLITQDEFWVVVNAPAIPVVTQRRLCGWEAPDAAMTEAANASRAHSAHRRQS